MRFERPFVSFVEVRSVGRPALMLIFVHAMYVCPPDSSGMIADHRVVGSIRFLQVSFPTSLQSATIPTAAAARCLKTNEKRYLRDAASHFLEGDLVVQGKALVAAFFCACAIAQTFIGPSFNPFTPVHTAVYTVTGVSNPDAVAVEPAADKPKED